MLGRVVTLCLILLATAQPVLAHNSGVHLIQNTTIGFGIVITVYILVFVVRELLK